MFERAHFLGGAEIRTDPFVPSTTYWFLPSRRARIWRIRYTTSGSKTIILPDARRLVPGFALYLIEHAPDSHASATLHFLDGEVGDPNTSPVGSFLAPGASTILSLLSNATRYGDWVRKNVTLA